jgi:hypothetical protein
VRLDLDRSERNAARPFDPVCEVSPLRRQWALWRWVRRFCRGFALRQPSNNSAKKPGGWNIASGDREDAT